MADIIIGFVDGFTRLHDMFELMNSGGGGRGGEGLFFVWISHTPREGLYIQVLWYWEDDWGGSDNFVDFVHIYWFVKKESIIYIDAVIDLF